MIVMFIIRLWTEDAVNSPTPCEVISGCERRFVVDMRRAKRHSWHYLLFHCSWQHVSRLMERKIIYTLEI